MKDIVDGVNANNIRTAQRTMERVTKGITEPEDKPVAKLPVEVFEEYFLPKFAGVGRDKTYTAKWVELSGSVFNPVELIGEEGEVVMTVPGIMQRQDLSKTTDKGLSKLGEDYSLLLANGKKDLAEAKVNKVIDEVIDGVGKLEDTNEVQVWTNIVTGYIEHGKLVIDPKEEKTKVVETQKTTSDINDDDVEY